EAGKYRRVLCIGAETLSRITDFTDRGTCVLLADAAGAAVLEATEDGSGFLDGDLYSDGQYWDLLYMPAGGSRMPATAETVAQRQHYAKMKGSEVFKVAVRMFVESTSALLDRHGVKAQDVDIFIPHQANLRIIEAANDALGFDLARLAFDGPEAELALTANTQPAVLTVSVAAAAVAAERGLAPALASGHSLGEYSALVVAGALAFPDAVRIVRSRGEFMQDAVPVGTGAMAAIMGLELAQVEVLCAETARGEVVEVANVNSPQQIVIAGHRAAVERAVALAAGRVLSALVKRIVEGARGVAIEDPTGLDKALSAAGTTA